MPQCYECVHCGVFSPKKGGWFYDREGVGRRINKPSLPYCIRLNMGIDPSEYTHNCKHFVSYEDTKKGEAEDKKP